MDNQPVVRRRRWWEWIVAYPAFVAMVVGAVPQYATWLSAFRHRVPASSVQIADENARLWRANLECARSEPQRVVQRVPLHVTAIVCPNADILLGVQTARGEPSLRWIGHDTLLRTTAFLRPSGVAIAAEQPGPSPSPEGAPVVEGREVLSQRLSGNRIERTVKRPDGTCHDEVVNIYTGRVKDRGEVSCSPPAK